ncbi:MAG: PTS transporter subunit IIC [Atopobiaceae bacterium]|jgi:PTS system ascorbate-specific IIC component|nr:PTS transporter subunit IIC [Atopobiaceae bacterium]MCI2172671.1 PTS transporter subunit IIC [Atopobiaceae bacterium]MCI2206978.1 PTS transporter subunit IIC [Atopobiaceae bacterium]
MLDAVLQECRNTALIMGLIALIGLLLQKKSATDVISGTVKTVIGFMIFNVGSAWMSARVTEFTTLFNTGFGIQGVTTQVEVATGLALNTYGTEVAVVMVLGFIFNLLFAKFTKFKAIFLTGQHFLYFSCVLALVLIALGLPTMVVMILGGIILGFCGAALPTLCQPFMNKITGADNIAMGHFNCIGYAASGYIGKLFQKQAKRDEEKGEDVKNLPKFFELFRDFVFSVALFMVVLFYVATIACVATGNMDAVTTVISKSASTNDVWFIWPLIEGLQFAAGMSVLIYGVRQFIAEITAAFVAISEKYIPDSKPAVDCPAVFPFAPNAVMIGFIGSFAGGLVAMAAMVLLGSPVIMIPAAGICFFSGGTCGVFGHAYGGWRGALLASFLMGILLCALPLVLYPAFSALGIEGASFPNIDYNIVGSIIYGVGHLFGL